MQYYREIRGHLSEAPPPVGRHAVGDPGRDPVGDSHRHGVGHQGLARGAAAGEHNLGAGEWSEYNDIIGKQNKIHKTTFASVRPS